MQPHSSSNGIRRVLLAALMLVMLGMGSMPTESAAAGVAFVVPTVGEIVVDSYDCETGELAFHVPVADLFAVDPNVTHFSDYPLVYAWEAYYGPEEDLQQVFSGVFVWTPTEEQSPYTGTVHLQGIVPPTHDGKAIVSIAFRVNVGSGDTLDDPADSSYKSYLTDCPSPDDDLVSPLIAKLKEILLDILNA